MPNNAERSVDEMKYEAEIKELLINNAIHLIAEGGFEAATVKALSTCGGDLPGFRMNDVYIYRLFGSKEELYRAAFIRLDSELFHNVRKALQGAHEEVGASDRRTLIFSFLNKFWDYITRDKERCRCYVRYMYSVYFAGESREAHNELFSGIIEDLSPAFKEEADVTAIIHSAFISIFDFALRVFNGDLEDNEINRPHIFNVIYCIMSTYFKTEGDSDGGAE